MKLDSLLWELWVKQRAVTLLFLPAFLFFGIKVILRAGICILNIYIIMIIFSKRWRLRRFLEELGWHN